ncbi:MAG: hypothetical protein K6E20_03720 [Acholeplasmatales bacterium]|nr:hypothetical protein [Acholeplasmatales bacterium]
MSGTKNSLIDVHNLLMEQMERLMDAESPEEIEKEISRSKAVADVSKVIVDNSKTMLDAVKTGLEYGENFSGTILGIEMKENS